MTRCLCCNKSYDSDEWAFVCKNWDDRLNGYCLDCADLRCDILSCKVKVRAEYSE